MPSVEAGIPSLPPEPTNQLPFQLTEHVVWAWPGRAGSRRPGEEPVFQHVPLPAYRCVDSNDRWQWLYRGHQLLHFNESFIGTAKNQTEFSLTQRDLKLYLIEARLWAEPYFVNFWHHCYANISFEYIVRFQGRYLSCALILLFLLAVVTT